MRRIFLFIDDDPIANLINRKFLETSIGQVEIHSCESAYKGLVFLQTVDSYKNLEIVIFLDINMPGMNGWDFLQEIDREFTEQEFTIYMLSSSVDSEDKRKAESYRQVKSFISKPLTKDKILHLNLA